MIHEFKSTKILKTRYDNSHELFQKVYTDLDNITRQPNKLPGFIRNGRCSFHNIDESGKQLYKWNDLAEITFFLKDNMKKYLRSVSIDVNDVSITGMWANRYPPGTFVDKHNHKRLKGKHSILIGALYYIRKDRNAGSLFIDIPDHGEYNVEMEEGDVVIFHSSLDHWTTPNNSDNDKYVIGMEVVVGEEGITLDEI